MNKTMKFAWAGLAAALLAAPCFAQNAENRPDEQAKFFRLDFTVKELEGGRVVNARNYSASISSRQGDTTSIRSGDKAPVQTGGGNSFTYVDVGVSIDCSSLRLVESQLALHVSADISGLGSEIPAGSTIPVIRQIKWGSSVLVPLKKPVTIFSSDGASTKRQTQLELTATPEL
jgi:hypothetical protein